MDELLLRVEKLEETCRKLTEWVGLNYSNCTCQCQREGGIRRPWKVETKSAGIEGTSGLATVSRSKPRSMSTSADECPGNPAASIKVDSSDNEGMNVADFVEANIASPSTSCRVSEEVFSVKVENEEEEVNYCEIDPGLFMDHDEDEGKEGQEGGQDLEFSQNQDPLAVVALDPVLLSSQVMQICSPHPSLTSFNVWRQNEGEMKIDYTARRLEPYSRLRLHGHIFNCPFCTDVYQAPLMLSTHIRLFHQQFIDGKSYICPNCGSPYKSLKSLKSHLNSINANPCKMYVERMKERSW